MANATSSRGRTHMCQYCMLSGQRSCQTCQSSSLAFRPARRDPPSKLTEPDCFSLFLVKQRLIKWTWTAKGFHPARQNSGSMDLNNLIKPLPKLPGPVCVSPSSCQSTSILHTCIIRELIRFLLFLKKVHKFWVHRSSSLIGSFILPDKAESYGTDVKAQIILLCS